MSQKKITRKAAEQVLLFANSFFLNAPSEYIFFKIFPLSFWKESSFSFPFPKVSPFSSHSFFPLFSFSLCQELFSPSLFTFTTYLLTAVNSEELIQTKPYTHFQEVSLINHLSPSSSTFLILYLTISLHGPP